MRRFDHSKAMSMFAAIALLFPPANAATVVAPPAPRAASRPTGDWRDWPVTPGTWVYRQDARGSIALFGVPGQDADVTLRCDRTARMIYLSRRGAVAAPSTMTVRTSSTQRQLAAQPTGGTIAYMAVALTPADGLLDAMSFSRGRFTIEQPGLPVLVVPAWAEVARITEDCRQ